MRTVRWIAFCVETALTETVIHFMPGARNVAAPYPATMRLSVFGNDLERQHVALEGARLRQPDGVRVKDVFPPLRDEKKGAFGLEIELTTSQPRIDLSSSSCIVELRSRGHSTKYRPVRAKISDGLEKPADRPLRSLLAVEDGSHYTTLMAVNGSRKVVMPEVLQGCSTGKPLKELGNLSDHGIPAESASEFILTDPDGRKAGYADPDSQEAVIDGISLQGEMPPEVAYFAVYRDLGTKRPLSVCSL